MKKILLLSLFAILPSWSVDHSTSQVILVSNNTAKAQGAKYSNSPDSADIVKPMILFTKVNSNTAPTTLINLGSTAKKRETIKRDPTFDRLIVSNAVPQNRPPIITNVLLSEGFDADTTIPSGWFDSPGTTSSRWRYGDGTYRGPDAPHGGAYAAFYNVSDIAEGVEDTLISPAIDFSAHSHSYSLSFWSWHSSGDDSVIAYLSEAGVLTRLLKTPSSITWLINTIAFNSSSTDGRICFIGYSLHGSYNLYIDDVLIVDSPPNDSCGNVTPVILSDSIPVQFHGDNTGATSFDDCYPFSLYPNVWEAFTLPTCMDVTLDYCGTAPEWGNAWLSLMIGCPCTGISPIGSSDRTTCPDGNVTIVWHSLPEGTYYYPVMLDSVNGAGPGPYMINVTGTACIHWLPECHNVFRGGVLNPGVPIQFVGDNNGAGVDCPNLGYAEWAVFTLDVCQDVTIDYCGTNPVFDNVFIVIMNECCGPYQLARRWLQNCQDGNWFVEFQGLQPGEYWYPIIADSGSLGPFIINVNGSACPRLGCNYVVGDINGSGIFNGLDVIYSVGYLRGGPVPPYSCQCPFDSGSTWYVAGDVNGSCSFNGLDVTYMVSYFKGGPNLYPCPDCPPSDLRMAKDSYITPAIQPILKEKASDLENGGYH